MVVEVVVEVEVGVGECEGGGIGGYHGGGL